MINNRQNNRRRGRGGGPRPNGASNGMERGNRIDNRARGNANQLYEKYKTAARDAQMQGDRVLAEYYLQFADHYFRVLNENRVRFDEQRRGGRDDRFERDDQEGGYEEDGETQGENEQFSARNRDYRSDQEPDRGQTAYENSSSQPYANGHTPAERGESEYESQDDGEQSTPRGARGRPRRAREDNPPVTERIEADRLPPSFAAAPANEDVLDVPKPKRRGRPPKAAAAVDI